MRIEVSPGEVRITKVEVHRHQAGLYVAQIFTPQDRRPSVVLSRGSRQGNLFCQAELYRQKFNSITKSLATQVNFHSDSMDEDEALVNGFTELDHWYKYGCLLVAIPSAWWDERESVTVWTPQSVDYLEP